jgi:hypothetical protein
MIVSAEKEGEEDKAEEFAKKVNAALNKQENYANHSRKAKSKAKAKAESEKKPTASKRRKLLPPLSRGFALAPALACLCCFDSLLTQGVFGQVYASASASLSFLL